MFLVDVFLFGSRLGLLVFLILLVASKFVIVKVFAFILLLVDIVLEFCIHILIKSLNFFI
jgi:hypothetical protein